MDVVLKGGMYSRVLCVINILVYYWSSAILT